MRMSRGDVKIEWITVDSISADPLRPRRMERSQQEALRASLKEFGVVKPLVLNRRDGSSSTGTARCRNARGPA